MIPTSDPATFLVMLAVKASVVLALGAIAHVLLRRRASAATRHWVWTLAVACLLALPALTVALPSWTVEVPVAPTASGVVLENDEGAGAAARPRPQPGLRVSLPHRELRPSCRRVP